MGRWQRLMDYCDGKEPYSGDAYSDVSLEHLRTDIIALNDEANCARARILELEALANTLAMYNTSMKKEI